MPVSKSCLYNNYAANACNNNIVECMFKKAPIVVSIGLNSSLALYQNRDEHLIDETAG